MWYHTIELGVEPNFSVVEMSVVRERECRVWGLGFGTYFGAGLSATDVRV